MVTRPGRFVDWGVGGHQVGIDAISALLTAAAKTVNYETWGAETLASSFDDELGITVELEHSQDQRHDRRNEPAGNFGPPPRGSTWKVIDRHGDGLMTVEIGPEGRR